MGLSYNMWNGLAKICFTTFARWEVTGRDAVPPKGPLIIVSNHLANADAPMLAASIPRGLNFSAKKSLFTNPVASTFLKAVRVHPLDRDRADLQALRWNLELLKRDQPIVLFPEGTRSRGGGMSRGKAGIAYIAARSQAPILPVGITGTENIKGFWRMAFPLCRLNVRIGDPFSLPVIEGKMSRPVLEHLTDMIMYRIAALLPPEYRGYYAAQEVESRG